MLCKPVQQRPTEPSSHSLCRVGWHFHRPHSMHRIFPVSIHLNPGHDFTQWISQLPNSSVTCKLKCSALEELGLERGELMVRTPGVETKPTKPCNLSRPLGRELDSMTTLILCVWQGVVW